MDLAVASPWRAITLMTDGRVAFQPSRTFGRSARLPALCGLNGARRLIACDHRPVPTTGNGADFLGKVTPFGIGKTTSRPPWRERRCLEKFGTADDALGTVPYLEYVGSSLARHPIRRVSGWLVQFPNGVFWVDGNTEYNRKRGEKEMRHRPSVFFVPLWILLFAVASAKTSAAEYRVTRSFNVAAEPACMPALTKAPNGDLLVAFSTEWEPFPAGGVLKLIVSKDHGKTWSKPRILWKAKDPRVTIQVSNGMQTLSNGEILLPVSYCIIGKRKNVDPNEKRPFHIYDIKEDHPDHRREVRLLRSKDSGRSWTIENPKLENPWARFGRLLEARDGRLIMCGYGWYVESRDFGKSMG